MENPRYTPSLYIGIDPGTETGFAIWDRHTQQFRSVESMMIHQALVKTLELKGDIKEVVIEKPPANFRANNRMRLQGAGSIKRDFSIWEDFLNDHRIPFRVVQPAGKRGRSLTKMKADYFKTVTGYQGSTNNHGRDAAMQVFQLR